jgi:hypothetical protein
MQSNHPDFMPRIVGRMKRLAVFAAGFDCSMLEVCDPLPLAGASSSG